MTTNKKPTPKINPGSAVIVRSGDYEKVSLDGESWGHTEEIQSLMKDTPGIALFAVWEGAFMWNVLVFEGGQTECAEGFPVVLIVRPNEIKAVVVK